MQKLMLFCLMFIVSQVFVDIEASNNRDVTVKHDVSELQARELDLSLEITQYEGAIAQAGKDRAKAMEDIANAQEAMQKGIMDRETIEAELADAKKAKLKAEEDIVATEIEIRKLEIKIAELDEVIENEGVNESKIDEVEKESLGVLEKVQASLCDVESAINTSMMDKKKAEEDTNAMTKILNENCISPSSVDCYNHLADAAFHYFGCDEDDVSKACSLTMSKSDDELKNIRSQCNSCGWPRHSSASFWSMYANNFQCHCGYTSLIDKILRYRTDSANYNKCLQEKREAPERMQKAEENINVAEIARQKAEENKKQIEEKIREAENKILSLRNSKQDITEYKKEAEELRTIAETAKNQKTEDKIKSRTTKEGLMKAIEEKNIAMTKLGDEIIKAQYEKK